jgi:hypothetical protein
MHVTSRLELRVLSKNEKRPFKFDWCGYMKNNSGVGERRTTRVSCYSCLVGLVDILNKKKTKQSSKQRSLRTFFQARDVARGQPFVAVGESLDVEVEDKPEPAKGMSYLGTDSKPLIVC